MFGKMMVFNETLAMKIGVKNAIVFSVIHQDSEMQGENHDGSKWLKISHKDFEDKLPFLSYNTIIRRLNDLKDLGLILINNYNESDFDNTNWYAVNYQGFANIMENN